MKLLYTLLLILQCHISTSFYIPGVAPVEFKKGQKIEVKAVKMTSVHTQLPFEYYSLPFCLPKNGPLIYKSENLGEVLRGDRIVNTPYDIKMAEDVKCRLVCHEKNNPMNWNNEDSAKVASRIEHEYFVHLLVDNLPVATKHVDATTSELKVEQGYKLGIVQDNKAYIFNHLNFKLKYHMHTPNYYRVVGFEVEPVSVDKDDLKFHGDECEIGSNAKPQIVNVLTGTQLYFTYSVEWAESDVSWASRWDVYLGMKDVKIHWFSIINSLVVIFFLAGILTMIMVRTLRRDIARYNSDDDTEDLMEETGWKLVHGDVFRPPKNRLLFCAVIGSGGQLFFMTLVTIVFAMMGMLSPSSRGALMSSAIFIYVLFSLSAGVFAARLYVTLKGKQWKQAAFLTATLYPGIVATTCFVLNLFIWGKHSSGAVPFTTMLTLLALWFCISLPLVYLGFYYGYSKPAISHPVRTNFIPRKVPEQVWYMNIVISTLMAGLLPFGAVLIELFFIFNALWENQFYYLFGFLFFVFCILVISVSQISIVMVYFQLCGEDYNWWWRSFIVSGGSSVYILVYAIFYFFKLEITETIPTLLYAGYTSLIVLTFWMLTGTIGFTASYLFIRKIYGAVKID